MFWSKTKTQDAPAEGALPAASLLSDAGCHRELNEDSGSIVRAGNGRHGDRGLLAVVADGMGGHEAGEVASRTAVETISRAYPLEKGTPGEALAASFHKAHREIRRMAQADPKMKGMGTTCTSLAITGDRAWAAHVGDSRLYLVRDGGVYQLSEDHTQCMAMVRQGLLSIEEARKHEDRNLLQHAMGTRKELVLMSWPEPMAVKPGDAFVLCSDGLHDLVADTEIRDAVRGSIPEEACRKLVRMARERGGYDDITVAVVFIPGGRVPAGAGTLQETRQYEVHG
ncbi:MAG: serine/threonine-protein phosphatase [Acidobacteria bacterium]|nr:serine/threonine-protein phosphatase [Acidobacteriota bacterium]